VNLALERGEVGRPLTAGRGRASSPPASCSPTSKITILMQLRSPSIPTCRRALVADLPDRGAAQILRLIFARQVMGRPYLAPPGIPADRVEALRKAFMDTMADTEFLAEAEKAQLEIRPYRAKRCRS